ncbi:SpoIID/LytB domain protein [Sediminihabitans luteus]|uniref:SpoIID/LytB domain protein n=1 Tax=Sediminihabitans luteus TaxID=1138585 RepID=A0A2M9CDQ0_9CELL|nr:SpoIID/LytB domain-containing protein [Sediminihabitans luteus]PJJ69992.1 SpoIID/LytB domain protein [Sediminihabitans luteus]GII99313.1 hypothetical protein Slu03_16910 [Sediminihabitans luteus]
MRRLGATLIAAALAVVLGLGALPAHAATTTVTGLVTGASVIKPGASTTVRATLQRGSTAVSGTVWLQKYTDGRWVDAATVTVEAGRGYRVIYPKGSTSYRMRYGSATSSTFRVTISRADFLLAGRITGPTSVAAGGSTTVRASFTGSGAPVRSTTVWLQKYAGGAWSNAATIGVTDGVGTRVIYPKGSTSYRLYHPATRTFSSVFRVSAASVPSTFTITGSGYGHGVGMSQYGAYAQALAGRTAKAILEYYYRGADVSWRTTERNVAVQVFGPEPYGYTPGRYSDEKATTTTTVSGGPWRVVAADGTVLRSGSSTSTIAWRAMADGRIKAWAGGRAYYDPVAIRLEWSGTRYLAGSRAAVATVAGAQGTYRHGRFTVRGIDGRVNVVNDVLLNTEYLYGISEMPSSWGSTDRSALAAQAIAARSYAMRQVLKPACACQVVDDVRDQNYTGWRKENEGTDGRWGKIWKAAVDDTVRTSTSAMLLTYQGAPITTHYFSSSGGRTVSSEDVWSSVVPYERSVADPWSLSAPGNTMSRWTRTLTQASARTLFSLPDVSTIRVSRTSSGGTMLALTATSSSGATRTISGASDSLRGTLGRATTAGSLPAAWITSIG